MGLVPATDPSPADWFVDADGPWYVKATYGPPGLEVYARVSLQDDDVALLVAVLRCLAAHTVTPDVVHVGVWEGWGHSDVQGVRFAIPSRTYALLTGPVTDALDPVSLGLDPHDSATPHLVWPDDRAWCVSWDVDEERHFTVGGSERALADIARATEGRVTVVPYGTADDRWNW